MALTPEPAQPTGPETIIPKNPEKPVEKALGPEEAVLGEGIPDIPKDTATAAVTETIDPDKELRGITGELPQSPAENRNESSAEKAKHDAELYAQVKDECARRDLQLGDYTKITVLAALNKGKVGDTIDRYQGVTEALKEKGIEFALPSLHTKTRLALVSILLEKATVVAENGNKSPAEKARSATELYVEVKNEYVRRGLVPPNDCTKITVLAALNKGKVVDTIDRYRGVTDVFKAKEMGLTFPDMNILLAPINVLLKADPPPPLP